MINISAQTVNLKANYQSLKMDFIFDSVYEGLTQARIYVNNPEKHSISIVHEGVAYYFGGESKTANEYHETVNYFKSVILPDRNPKMKVAKIIFTSEIWKELLLEAFADLEVKVIGSNLYHHRLSIIPEYQPVDSKIDILRITDQLLSRQYQNKQGLVNEINWMWGSAENFYRHGFGFCGVTGTTITGWCTAEYMSKRACGIGVETVKQFQKQGVASSTATKLLQHCAQRNIKPHWNCWVSNIPSVKTAEKCGFEKLLEYKVIFIKF